MKRESPVFRRGECQDHRITYHETDEAYLIHKDDWDYISKGVQEMFQRETELNSTGVQSNYEYEI